MKRVFLFSALVLACTFISCPENSNGIPQGITNVSDIGGQGGQLPAPPPPPPAKP